LVAPVLPSTAITFASAGLEVDHAVDDDGRALVGAGLEAALDLVEPSAAELLDVDARDLAQRRVVLVAEVSRRPSGSPCRRGVQQLLRSAAAANATEGLR
jgi:hypothetical protein